MAITVHFSSNVTPTLDLSVVGGETSGGAGGFADWLAGALLRFARPSVTVSTPVGDVHEAPYGEPSDGLWRIVLVVLAVGAVGALVLAALGLRSLFRRV